MNHAQTVRSIWRFPKTGYPTSSILRGFSIINIYKPSSLGYPHSSKLPYFQMKWYRLTDDFATLPVFWMDRLELLGLKLMKHHAISIHGFISAICFNQRAKGVRLFVCSTAISWLFLWVSSALCRQVVPLQIRPDWCWPRSGAGSRSINSWSTDESGCWLQT